MRFKLLTITTAILFSICFNVYASPTLSKNAKGEDVITLQKKLYLIGYEISEIDGVFGNETEKAVLAFQKDNQISATGIVTNVTWRALQSAKPIKGRELPSSNKLAGVKNVKEPKILTNKKDSSPTLSKNSTGADVTTLQKKLYLAGYNITEIDGVFGNETEKAVIAFQKDQKMSATGIVTNIIWQALEKAKPIKGRELPNKQTAKLNTVKDPKNPVLKKNLVPYGKTFINRQQGIEIVETAKNYIGVPYVFGGNTPKGFDCSGFLEYVFKQNGFVVPRLADEQYMLGTSAKVSQLTMGDLVFFSTYASGASHCGFYVGDRRFLHASSSRGIRIDSLDSDYWSSRFLGARKIID